MSSARAALLVCDRDAPSNPFLRARNRTTEIGIRVRRDLPDIRQQPARRRTVRRRAQTLPCLSIRSFNRNCASPTSLDLSELARRIGGPRPCCDRLCERPRDELLLLPRGEIDEEGLASPLSRACAEHGRAMGLPRPQARRGSTAAGSFLIVSSRSCVPSSAKQTIEIGNEDVLGGHPGIDVGSPRASDNR